MRGQHDGDGRCVAVLFALTFEGEAHGVRVRHIALQRLEDGGLQSGGVVTFEQTQQRGGDGAEIGAAFGGARMSKVWLAGAARARRSLARCWRAARFSSTSAWTWAGSSICAPLS